LAKLFDTDGDGKADLTGCNPGWGCELVIEHHLKNYQLRGTVTHKQGSYCRADRRHHHPLQTRAAHPLLHLDALLGERRAASPGTGCGLAGGARFPHCPASKGRHPLPNGKNYGFKVNSQHIVANKAFAEKNPAAAKLFEVMQLPVADINAQNLRMSRGENKASDIERHTDGWIKAHQDV
jgi:glycine betaine/proline transport system substrate-binding protein